MKQFITVSGTIYAFTDITQVISSTIINFMYCFFTAMCMSANIE